MKRISLFLSLVLISLYTFAQAPAGYYNPATGLSGTPLRQALHDIIDNHTSVSYSSLLTHYQTTDKKANGKVWDMYSDNPGGTPPYEFTFGNTCGNYSNEGDCYNREHSWPKSWFNDQSPMYSELFHIYPTDGKVNGIRSNYPYGEITNPTITTLNGSKLGPCSFPGYSGTVFEPINEYKGDFARTYFYMCTRYFNEDNGWQNNDMIMGANLKPWALDLMKKWSQQDPVSAKEIARNNAVYAIQGNRNPFIDHPEYVCMIWAGGTYCSIIPSITNIVKNPSNPGINVAVFISATITDDGSISSANLKWGTSAAALTNNLFMGGGANDVYTNTTAIPGQPDGTIVYFQITATDNASNVSTSSVMSYTIGTPASPAPVITNIHNSPNAPSSVDAVNVTATITDDGTVSGAKVLWGTDGVNFNNQITMTNSGSNYGTSTSIPSQTVGTVVYYKIAATDNLIQTTTSSASSYTVTAPSSGGTCATDLLFSEYVEGSSNNKYLEIYNGTGSSVNLSGYKLQLFANGTTTPTNEVTLTGTLANAATIVYKNSAAAVYLGTATISSACNYNGDDAIALVKISNGNYVDIIGKIGEDPGTEWTSGAISTLNKTIVRKATVLHGVTSNPSAGFPTLGTEWDVLAQDDVTGLGSHNMTCPSGTTSIQTLAITGTHFCPGAVVNVPYQVTGSINVGNVFNVELSNSTGLFTNPVIIGNVTSNALSGTISCAFPNNLVAGQYKVRVTASNPQTIGADNGSNLQVHAKPLINGGPDYLICKGTQVTLTATGGTIFFWDNGSDSSSTTVSPSITTTYFVTGIDLNGCSNTDTVTVYVEEPQKPVVLDLGSGHLQSQAFAGNQWYNLNGLIQGEDQMDFQATSNGTYYVIVTSSLGCASDTSNNITISNLGINHTAISHLSVQPNPNSGNFRISYESNSNSTIQISNVLGQVVLSKEVSSENHSKSEQINLSEMAKGIYWVTIQTSDWTSTQKILIK